MIVGDGRPLRFLVLVGTGWVGLRFVIVWSATGSLPVAVQSVVPFARKATAAPVQPPLRRPDTILASLSVAPANAAHRSSKVAAVAPIDPVSTAPAMIDVTSSDLRAAIVAPGEIAVDTPALSPIARALPAVDRPSRLSVSSWMIARGGTGLGASSLSPQLGGTQGGILVDYALGAGFSATGRVAAPAAGAGREVSLGVAWRPSGVPARIVVEQRLALDGGRGGPALGVSTGVSAVRLPARFRLDGYGQAGAIARVGIETYVDASVRAARPVAAVGGVAVDLGAGAWGGAQRGVARLDLGPSLGARLPVAGRDLRVTLDWRQRIAGNARPGSGPALTLGTDF